MENKIELHLVVGINSMKEGSTTYVKFKDKAGNLYWMYATLKKLTYNKAIFSTKVHKRHYKLSPKDIIRITLHVPSVKLEITETEYEEMLEGKLIPVKE